MTLVTDMSIHLLSAELLAIILTHVLIFCPFLPYQLTILVARLWSEFGV